MKISRVFLPLLEHAVSIWMDGSIVAAAAATPYTVRGAGNGGAMCATRIHFVHITARRIIIINSVVLP